MQILIHSQRPGPSDWPELSAAYPTLSDGLTLITRQPGELSALLDLTGPVPVVDARDLTPAPVGAAPNEQLGGQWRAGWLSWVVAEGGLVDERAEPGASLQAALRRLDSAAFAARDTPRWSDEPLRAASNPQPFMLFLDDERWPEWLRQAGRSEQHPDWQLPGGALRWLVVRTVEDAQAVLSRAEWRAQCRGVSFDNDLGTGAPGGDGAALLRWLEQNFTSELRTWHLQVHSMNVIEAQKMRATIEALR